MIIKGSLSLHSHLRKLLNEAFCIKHFNTRLNRKYTTNCVQNAEKLSGIFPTLTTPFTKLQDESISWHDLEENLLKLSKLDFAGICSYCKLHRL